MIECVGCACSGIRLVEVGGLLAVVAAGLGVYGWEGKYLRDRRRDLNELGLFRVALQHWRAIGQPALLQFGVWRL